MTEECRLPVTRAVPRWCREPFRIFFPLGAAASIFGVLLWPLFYAKIWPVAPQLQHPRIMIFGFGFAFVVGFLGTAWPRFLESRPLGKGEVMTLVITWLIAQVLYARHWLQEGDLAFAFHALVLIAILATRMRRRQREAIPPSGLALAFAAVAMAFLVALIWGLAPYGLLSWFPEMSMEFFLFTKLLVWHGLLLFPLLGVGSYLFPRILETASPVSKRRRSIAVWLSALIVVSSFAVEANGMVRTGNVLRFAALAVWAVLATPALLHGATHGTRGWALRIAIGSVAMAYLVRGFWPGPGYAITHILFVGGFGLTLLVIADRVTLGHADQLEKTPPKSRLWRWLVWLTLLAAATRASADIKASILVSHHIYAALLWAIVIGIWAWTHWRWWTRTP